jgi:hypothetical protein
MKHVHKLFFLRAIKTGLIALTGFIIYEILSELEKIWNMMLPDNEYYHFYKRRFLHFLALFLMDLFLLYIFFFIFDIEL